MATRVWEHFGVLPDPRVERTRKHQLEDLLTITLWTVICRADTWTDMAAFGEVKEHGVRTFLELPFGIPSHDTFGRVPAALDPEAFERSFHAWVMDGAGTMAGKHVAIDGKAIRRRLDRASGKVAPSGSAAGSATPGPWKADCTGRGTSASARTRAASGSGTPPPTSPASAASPSCCGSRNTAPRSVSKANASRPAGTKRTSGGGKAGWEGLVARRPRFLASEI